MYQSWLIYENKENIGSPMGHTKKNILRKKLRKREVGYQ
jgi:hypothetical protein